MASFNKVQDFIRAVFEGEHVLSTAGHTLKIMLTNVAPTATGVTIKANITEIATGNGYVAGGLDIENTGSETAGTYTIGATDKTWTATGGAIAQFRYVVLYNDTPTSPADPVIGWWDYGSAVDLSAGETFTTDFGATVLTAS